MHVSVVVTQFLRELFFALNLSLFVQSLRFPSQPHFGTPWCAVLGLHPLCPSVFRPIECFLYEGLHLLVWLCPCVLSSCLEKAPCFSHLYSILAGTRNLIYNAFLPFTKPLLTCAFDLWQFGAWWCTQDRKGSSYWAANDPRGGPQMIAILESKRFWLKSKEWHGWWRVIGWQQRSQ